MPQYKPPQKTVEVGQIITTPSPYGSHTSMVIEDLGDGRVKCKDDTHEYWTYKNRLDNNLCDPRRLAK